MLPVEYEKVVVDFPLEHVQTGLATGNGALSAGQEITFRQQ